MPEDIEMYFYVDEDDPELKLYADWHLVAPNQVHIHVGPAISVSKSWNSIADLCNGDILIMGNDDIVYRTQNWDNILIKRLSLYPDQIYCAWFDDGIDARNHCAFPIVSRKWYETLGYFTPGIFEFLYNDTWVFDIGKMVQRTLYIPEVYAEHEHFSTGKMQADETTIRPRRAGVTARDRLLFEKTHDVRIEDAEKLLKQIDAFK